MSGKVRHIGLSNFTPEAVAQWLQVCDEGGFAAPVALQPHYSLIHRRSAEQDYASLAQGAGLGVYPYRSLGGGFLSGTYRTEADLDGRARGAGVRGHLTPEGLALVDVVGTIADARGVAPSAVALAWLLGQPTVTAPLSSATSTGQLRESLSADDLTLTGIEMATLTAASAPYA